VRGAGYQPAGTGQAAPPSASSPEPAEPAKPAESAKPRSDVGDSRSDDPSDDEGDAGEP